MARVGHRIGDYIIQQENWNFKKITTFSFYTHDCQWYFESLLGNKALVKTIMKALQSRCYQLVETSCHVLCKWEYMRNMTFESVGITYNIHIISWMVHRYVHSVTYYLEVCRVVTPCYGFYVVLKKVK